MIIEKPLATSKEDLEAISAALARPDCLVMPEVFGKHRGFAHESIRDFVEAAATGQELPVSVEDGIKASQVIFALIESAEAGRPVKVEA